MAHSHPSLDHLHKVLGGSPSKEEWTRLCRIIEGMEVDALRAARPTIEAHLESWPMGLRTHRYETAAGWTHKPPPWWFAVASLHLSGHCSKANAEALARSPHLHHLTALTIHETQTDGHLGHALARSPCLQNLTSLSLHGSKSGDVSARALSTAKPSALAHLTRLHLCAAHLTDAGAKALAQSPCLQGLTELHLNVNNLTDAGAKALAQSPYLQGLTELHLAFNTIGSQGARALAQSLTHLTALDVSSNLVGPRTATELAQSHPFIKLFGGGDHKKLPRGAKPPPWAR
ncbi:MAG: hypothetical protein AAFX99_05655 [Myxococcota bacterium]